MSPGSTLPSYIAPAVGAGGTYSSQRGARPLSFLPSAKELTTKFGIECNPRIRSDSARHDLGKARIPLAILNKSGALTSEEAAIMRTHARIGYELLSQQGDYEPELLEVVLRHHELLDGSGYPDGLAGPQINDLVRLVTICDVYAALIERRSYKQAMEPAPAFKILQEMEGKLEGALVRAFAQVAKRSASPIQHDRLGPASPHDSRSVHY